MKTFMIPEQEAAVTTDEVDTPTPTGHEVLLRVTHAGVCHTDTHVQDGGYDLGTHGFLSMTSRGLTYPAVLGHETVGEVIATGELVKDVREGDIRLIYPWIGCGKCMACSSGDEHHCNDSQAHGIFSPGGFAEAILVRHEKYLINIDGLDPAWAATLACSGVTALSSAKKALAYTSDNDTVVVVGAGGVGLMTIAVLKALGHYSIAAVDLREENLSAARDLGATITVDSSKGSALKELRESAIGKVTAVIDLVNNGTTVGMGFEALDRGGTLIHVGLFGGEFPLPTALVAIKTLVLQGNYVGSLADLEKVVELAKQGRVPKIPIVAGSLNVEGINAGLRSLRDGTVAGRTVLSPS